MMERSPKGPGAMEDYLRWRAVDTIFWPIPRINKPWNWSPALNFPLPANYISDLSLPYYLSLFTENWINAKPSYHLRPCQVAHRSLKLIVKFPDRSITFPISPVKQNWINTKPLCHWSYYRSLILSSGIIKIPIRCKDDLDFKWVHQISNFNQVPINVDSLSISCSLCFPISHN